MGLGLWTARAIAITIFVLFILAHRPNYTTVIALPTAADPSRAESYVSVGSTGPEVLLTCPVGIDFSAAETVGIIDRASRRVVSVDLPSRAVSKVQTLNIEPSRYLKGALFQRVNDTDVRLWTWLQDKPGHQLEFRELGTRALVYDRPDRADLTTSRTSNQGIVRRLLHMGLNPSYVGNSDGAVPPPETTRPTSWTGSVSSDSGANYALKFDLSGRHALSVAFTGPDNVTHGYVLKDFMNILSAYAVKATAAGEVFVVVTSEAGATSTVFVHEWVVRLSAKEAKPAIFDMPFADTDCIPPQDFAVSERGEVYFLKVQERAVALVRVQPRTFLTNLGRWIESADAWHFEPITAKSATTPLFFASAKGFVTVTRGDPISRGDVVRNACEYVNKNWRLSALSLSPFGQPPPAGYLPPGLQLCRDKAAVGDGCSGCATGLAGQRWRPSKDLSQDMIAANEDVKGLPYNWGGHDTLEDFDAKVAAGRPAGQTCTAGSKDIVYEDPLVKDYRHIFPMGVDCSGFVTRAMGFLANDSKGAVHLPTGKLDETDPRSPDCCGPTGLFKVSDPVGKNFCERPGDVCMQPGDILDKESHHVRLFLEWTGVLHEPQDPNAEPTMFATFAESIPDEGVTRQVPLALKELHAYERRHVRRVAEPAVATAAGSTTTTASPAQSWSARDLLCVP
jgi:hypothetical protein